MAGSGVAAGVGLDIWATGGLGHWGLPLEAEGHPCPWAASRQPLALRAAWAAASLATGTRGAEQET